MRRRAAAREISSRTCPKRSGNSSLVPCSRTSRGHRGLGRQFPSVAGCIGARACGRASRGHDLVLWVLYCGTEGVMASQLVVVDRFGAADAVSMNIDTCPRDLYLGRDILVSSWLVQGMHLQSLRLIADLPAWWAYEPYSEAITRWETDQTSCGSRRNIQA